jgi:hypothetical protein
MLRKKEVDFDIFSFVLWFTIKGKVRVKVKMPVW